MGTFIREEWHFRVALFPFSVLSQAVHSGADLESAIAKCMGYQQGAKVRGGTGMRPCALVSTSTWQWVARTSQHACAPAVH